MRLRKRAAGLLLGAFIVFLMGTNAQAGWLLVISALLVGAVLAGIALPLFGLRGVGAEIVAPDEATQGERACVDVHLTARGRGVRWGLTLRDEHLAPVRSFVPWLRAGDRVEITTERTPARRGRRTTTHLEIRTAAPFGVAERRRRVPVEAETLVLPAIVPLGPLPFIDPIGTAEPAIHSAPRRGLGPEYLGIREYRTGDSMRHVHWASTARHGAVMVREFEEEQTRRLLIVVDTERDAPAEEDDAPTPLDRCCTAAASLATSALAHGQGARLVAASADGVEVLARSDEREMLRWLAGLDPTGSPLSDAVTELPADAMRGAESVVMVVPGWAENVARLVEAASTLRAVAPRVVAVVVGVGPHGEGALGDVAGSLVAAGAEVYPWPTSVGLDEVFGGAP